MIAMSLIGKQDNKNIKMKLILKKKAGLPLFKVMFHGYATVMKWFAYIHSGRIRSIDNKINRLKHFMQNLC
jgi:hypothetical protein